ncbi:MAG: ribokinase [Saprospiraceae bacterium]|nr:ribokinase [Saprospiraceae bacterium]
MSGILVVGSSNTDMVIKSARIPAPGETILGGDFFLNPGGKGANQAVAAARLGAPVTFLARIGNDIFGREALSGWQAEGIKTDHVVSDPTHPSGTALIMVDDNGANAISVALGANDYLSPADVDAVLQNSEPFDLVLTQLETPMETVEYLGSILHDSGTTFIVDPAPAAPLSMGLINSINILTPNQSEAELLTGIAVVDMASANQAAQAIRKQGVDTVLITMGEQGVFLCNNEHEQMLPAPKVKAIDTTAAGDTFNGALAAALCQGHSITSSIEKATLAAAFSTTRLGAQSSAPTPAALQAFTSNL